MLPEFDNVTGSVYILDKFHAVRKVSKVFSPKKETLKAVYEESKIIFAEGKYSDLMNLLSKKWFTDHTKNLRLNFKLNNDII